MIQAFGLMPRTWVAEAPAVPGLVTPRTATADVAERLVLVEDPTVEPSRAA